jgi:competence protein ComEC
MPKKLYKILAVLGVTFLISLALSFHFQNNQPRLLEVAFLDVGQGDSILIKSPYGQNILVDGGPDNSVVSRLEENLPWWDKTIDLAILTHPHDDHIVGLLEVAKRLKVQKFVYDGASFDNPNYQAWFDLIKNKKIPLVLVDHPQTVTLGPDCRLELIYPLASLVGKTTDNINNFSLVVRLVYGENSFLLTGDMEVEAERELLASGADIRAQILKVGHHGSDTASSQEFLDKISPQYAVIEVGKDNKFGLPSLRTIKRLERIGAEVMRTDENGTIVFTSDGKSLLLK